ncbi:MAG: STAS domain-containing protein [Spirochaetaceae bacterium]|jgi:SulP family sulfate permease|nr:STAS domain-containing protein [Spirochaetaceae bacterium]
MNKLKLFNIEDLIPRMAELFRPKGYDLNTFGKDCVAGIIVGIVALPLSMAFSIAAGGSPAQGLYTAIIAGFFISALGGSRYQIGGPTGAFVVIIFGVIAQHGMAGLIAASVLAGIFLVLMGAFGLGRFIKYIPYPVTTGFTTGIGLLIFSQQIKDFMGLEIARSSPDFLKKWLEHFQAIATIDFVTLAVGLGTMAIILVVRRFAPRIPAAASGVLVVTILCAVFKLDVQTIATRFGGIPNTLPAPDIPPLNFTVFRDVFPSALSIALLAAIESLLSAVVADGMTGDRHNSNTELIAQGVGNIASAIFGGIPATGAIARTATNIKAGAASPVAGIVHALTLVLFILFLSPAASAIPLASLSAVLIIVSWDMSNIPRFIRIIRTAPKSDASVLITTFLLTVLVDLSYAVIVGVLLAVFLFMRRMIEMADIRMENDEFVSHLAFGDKEHSSGTIKALSNKDTDIFEISGPFFFGVADMLQNTLRHLSKTPKKIILRMRSVPAVDSTGIAALESFFMSCQKQKIRLIITECGSQPRKALIKSGFIELLGEENCIDSLDAAIDA